MNTNEPPTAKTAEPTQAANPTDTTEPVNTGKPAEPTAEKGTFPFAFPDYVASQKFLRKEWQPDLKHGIIRNQDGTPVKFHQIKTGYLSTKVCFEGIQTSILAHRALYIAAQNGITLPRKKTINHINGIKTDNRIENLELKTLKENIREYYIKGKQQNGSPLKSLTREDVIRIRRECAGLNRKEHAKTVKNFAQEFDVSTRTVRNAEKGRTYCYIREETP